MKACALFRIAILVPLTTSLQVAVAYEPSTPSNAPTSIRQEDDCDKATRDGLLGLCSIVSGRVPEPDAKSPNTYLYQTVILRCAGVNFATDSGEVVRKKVQHLWLTCVEGGKLTCDTFGFNVANGSVLKLAVVKRNSEFIDDATDTWKIPLNDVDESDGRTVLDYIAFELEKVRGTKHAPALERMYEQFAKAGAKLRKDLSAEDRFKDPYEVEIRPLLTVWDKACYFSEGLAAVKKDGKWGYVDRQHQIIVSPKYDGAFSFWDGRAAVVKDGKWGYIDRKGTEVDPLINSAP